jgi:predicted nuclease of predicted toxin-antitoxin system
MILKIKVDEDLPKRVAEAVRGVVPNTLTVIDEGLSGILDPALWETVQREQRFLITGDKTFANIKKYHQEAMRGFCCSDRMKMESLN